MSFIYEHDFLTDTQHGVHVVGVDDRGDSIFMGDVAQKFVDED